MKKYNPYYFCFEMLEFIVLYVYIHFKIKFYKINYRIQSRYNKSIIYSKLFNN